MRNFQELVVQIQIINTMESHVVQEINNKLDRLASQARGKKYLNDNSLKQFAIQAINYCNFSWTSLGIFVVAFFSFSSISYGTTRSTWLSSTFTTLSWAIAMCSYISTWKTRNYFMTADIYYEKNVTTVVLLQLHILLVSDYRKMHGIAIRICWHLKWVKWSFDRMLKKYRN